MPMATKLGRMMTYLEGLLTIVIQNFDVVLQGHVTNADHYISTTTVVMDDELPWWAPTYNVTWPFDHMVLRYHVTT